MKEMLYLIHRLHYVENVIKVEVEIYASQYEYEEAESYLPSDKSEVVDSMYCEESSCEDNGESCCSSQKEDSGRTCFSSCESGANWEEESNDGSKYSYESKGISSFSKSENEFPV